MASNKKKTTKKKTAKKKETGVSVTVSTDPVPVKTQKLSDTRLKMIMAHVDERQKTITAHLHHLRDAEVRDVASNTLDEIEPVIKQYLDTTEKSIKIANVKLKSLNKTISDSNKDVEDDYRKTYRAAQTTYDKDLRELKEANSKEVRKLRTVYEEAVNQLEDKLRKEERKVKKEYDSTTVALRKKHEAAKKKATKDALAQRTKLEQQQNADKRRETRATAVKRVLRDMQSRGVKAVDASTLDKHNYEKVSEYLEDADRYDGPGKALYRAALSTAKKYEKQSKKAIADGKCTFAQLNTMLLVGGSGSGVENMLRFLPNAASIQQSTFDSLTQKLSTSVGDLSLVTDGGVDKSDEQ